MVTWVPASKPVGGKQLIREKEGISLAFCIQGGDLSSILCKTQGFNWLTATEQVETEKSSQQKIENHSLCLILAYSMLPRMTSNQTILSDRLTVTAFVVSLWSTQICISFTDSSQIGLLRHQNSKIHYTQLSSVPFSDSKVGITLPRPMMTLGTHRAAKILPSSPLNSVEGRCYPAQSTSLFATGKESRKNEALTPLGTGMHVPGFY